MPLSVLETPLEAKDVALIAEELQGKKKLLDELVKKLNIAMPEAEKEEDWRHVFDIIRAWERKQKKNASKQKLIKIFQSLAAVDSTFNSLAMILAS